MKPPRTSFGPILLLAASEVLPCFPAFAERLPFRAYGQAEGLAGDHVRAILQDRQGFLWMATNARVSRFDGHAFRNFGLDDGLQVPSAWALAEGTDGRLYVLAAQRVFRRLPRNARGGAEFTPVEPPGLDKHVEDVLAMVVAPDGALLLAGSRGAARVVVTDGAQRVEPVEEHGENGSQSAWPERGNVWRCSLRRGRERWQSRPDQAAAL